MRFLSRFWLGIGLSTVLIAAQVPAGATAARQNTVPTNPQSQCVPTVAGVASVAVATMAANTSSLALSTAPADSKHLYVVTTVAPITNIAFNIGGNRIQLHGLIPEGVDSHTFEPKPSDAVYLAKADLVFVNGLHLEDPTLRLASATMRKDAVLTQLGASTLTEKDWVFDFSFPKDRGDPNPHLWMNPFYALHYASVFRDMFSQADPADAAYYAANYATFESRILTLDQAICDAIASIPVNDRKLLTYHDSYAYFAPRYGMTVIGAIQPSDFSEPSAQDVANLINQLKAEKIPAIFGSEVFPSKVVEQIGQEAGVQYISTLADDDLPNQQNDRLHHSYLQLMVNDVKTMATALGGSADALKAVDTANIPGSDESLLSN